MCDVKDLITKLRYSSDSVLDDELKEVYNYYNQLSDLVRFLPIEFILFKNEIITDFQRAEIAMITRGLMKI